MSNIITLPPFKKFCMTIGNLPASYLESMTYYEALCWFTDYLSNTIIPAVNNNSEVVTELQEKFTELQNFVNNYFDNLDVQDEINKKLDSMVEDGSLTELVNKYFEEIGSQLDTSYISYNKLRANSTDYYITTINKKDLYNNDNILRMGIALEDPSMSSTEAPLTFAHRKNTLFACNAGVFYSLETHPSAYGIVIKDGKILKNGVMDLSDTFYEILAIMKDTYEFKTYPANGTVTAEEMIADGVLDAFVGFYTIIKNGVAIDQSELSPGAHDPHPRQVVCKDNNDNYLIFTCDGRTNDDRGMTINEVTTILKDYNINFAFMLDGGGSTSTIVKGEKINKDIDNYGMNERPSCDFLFLDKDNNKNNGINSIYSDLGEFIYNYDVREKEKEYYYNRNARIYDLQYSKNIYDPTDPRIIENSYIDENGTFVEDASEDVFIGPPIHVINNGPIVIKGNGNRWNVFGVYDHFNRFIERRAYVENTPIQMKTNYYYIRPVISNNVKEFFDVRNRNTPITAFIPHDRYRGVDLYVEGVDTSMQLRYNMNRFKRLKVWIRDENNNYVCKDIRNNFSGHPIGAICTNTQYTGSVVATTSCRLLFNNQNQIHKDREYSIYQQNNGTITTEEKSWTIALIKGYYYDS